MAHVCVCVFVRVRAQYVYTRGRADKVYKVWDLKNYEHIYSIHDNNIYEIKISPVPLVSSLCCSRSFYVRAHPHRHQRVTCAWNLSLPATPQTLSLGPLPKN